MSPVPSHFTDVKTEAQRRGGSWPRSHGLFVAKPGFRLQLGFLAVSLGAEHLTEAEKKAFSGGCGSSWPSCEAARPGGGKTLGGCSILTQLLPQGPVPAPRMRPCARRGSECSAQGDTGRIRPFAALPPLLPGRCLILKRHGEGERLA